jgi:hypothetical protein
MLKVTFTVDEQTVTTLKRIAERMKKPQSVIFREAIQQYSEQADRLSSEERARLLAVMDRMKARKPTRTNADTDAELVEIRKSRRKGGRRTPVQ